jgi:hypothetical protein
LRKKTGVLEMFRTMSGLQTTSLPRICGACGMDRSAELDLIATHLAGRGAVRDVRHGMGTLSP